MKTLAKMRAFQLVELNVIRGGNADASGGKYAAPIPAYPVTPPVEPPTTSRTVTGNEEVGDPPLPTFPPPPPDIPPAS